MNWKRREGESFDDYRQRQNIMKHWLKRRLRGGFTDAPDPVTLATKLVNAQKQNQEQAHVNSTGTNTHLEETEVQREAGDLPPGSEV